MIYIYDIINSVRDGLYLSAFGSLGGALGFVLNIFFDLIFLLLLLLLYTMLKLKNLNRLALILFVIVSYSHFLSRLIPPIVR